MSKRQAIILQELRTLRTVSVGYLAWLLDAPHASVRRDIQKLRRDHIITDATGSGLYRFYGD
jgi:DeoR/GlpR family transcriptional regulator of sugar metabolism